MFLIITDVYYSVPLTNDLCDIVQPGESLSSDILAELFKQDLNTVSSAEHEVGGLLLGSVNRSILF